MGLADILNEEKKEKPRIIIVDDEPSYRKFLLYHFQKHFDVVEAQTGEEAIERFDDTIMTAIMDARLPGMDGFDTSLKLWEIEPFFPIIMLTAHDGDYEKEKYERIKCSFDAYIKKGNEESLDMILKVRSAIKGFQRAKMIYDYTQRLRMVSDLENTSAGFVHELKNLLHSMSGFSNIVNSVINNPGSKKEDLANCERYLTNIISSVFAGSELCDQYLDLFRSSRTREAETFDINDYLKASLDALKRSRGVRDKASLDYFVEIPDTNLQVFARRYDIYFILSNLVANAIHAVEGQKEKRIIVRSYDIDDKLYIKVQDTGIGIPEEKIAEIFKPFETTKGEGTGFGLYLAQKCARRYNGLIDVVSKQGIGTAFTVELDLDCMRE